MITLYTAVGRFEQRSDGHGNKYPVIIINQQEYQVTIPEMLCWTCLSWHIADMYQIRLLYEYKTKVIDDFIYGFNAAYVERLEQRGLIVSGKGGTANEARYNLLKSLFVIPVTSSFFMKTTAFLKFVLKDHAPLHKAKAVFRKERLCPGEKRILDLAKQTMLTVSELIMCVEIDVFDLPSEDSVMDALYDDEDTTNVTIAEDAAWCKQQRAVLNIVSTLYLRRLIIFGRI